MSVERRRRADGRLVYRVRWRDGNVNRVKTFDQLRDAHRWDAEVRRRKQLGEVGLVARGQEPLHEFADEWWSRYAEPFLSPKTRLIYRGIIDRRILPALGKKRLVELTPEAVELFAYDLRRTGVGAASIQKALVVLQGMMKKAVLWGRVTSNPVAAVTKPRQTRRIVTSALSPTQIEAIRAHLDLRDATLVSVLAYAGLRPGEALALRWGDIRERTVLIARAASLGEIKDTKTGRIRSVRILAPLSDDLAAWRAASGNPSPDALVFPDSTGTVVDAEGYRNWRRRRFRTAILAAGLPATTRPYDLRHAFVSLLLAEGRSVIDVARQAGHAPTMTLDTYGHVIDELDDTQRISAEEMILRARAATLGIDMTENTPEPDLGDDRLRCEACGTVSEGSARGWRAVHGREDDDRVVTVIFCPVCANQFERDSQPDPAV